jgi:uncharacterized membrane protein
MRPIGTYLAPARFLLFLVVLAAATFVAIGSFPLAQALMIGFDAAAVVFITAVAPLLRRRDANEMREIARRNDANRVMLLGLSSIVIVAILVAVGAEVTQKGQMQPAVIGLVIATLALAWLFSNIVYALHYAHIYYLPDAGGRHRCGIDFPGKGDPDYSEFVYFAFTLGMTFQTSDVDITSRQVRRIVTLHCLAAFVFNIGVLAFTINVLGGGS